MLSFFQKLFATDFMPHGFCIREPGIIQLHLVSDILIAISYFLIPLALLYFIRKRRDLAYPWMFGLFSLFILSCGTTHMLAAYVMWNPVYRLDGLVKAITALASLPTALLLIRVLPNAIQLPSPAQLRTQNEALAREIQERHRAEAEVRRLNQELERRVAERTAELEARNLELKRANEDLNHFAWAASHDLQEPLRVLVLYSQLVERTEAGRLSEDGRKLLASAADNARRMQALISDLLSYLEVTSGPSTEFPVTSAGQCVDEARANLSAAVDEAGAEIVCGAMPAAVAIKHAHMVQVFQNLLSNAIKYRSEQAPRIEVQAVRRGSDWLFSVRDNGIGVPAEYQNYVFGIFKRLHPKDVPGTGLGLALCQRIVERHGGRIWLESAGEGQGSTVYFTLLAADL